MSQAIYSEFSRYRCLLIVAFSVLALDQLTKNWVIHNLKLDSFESIEVIGDFFYIIHVVNEGAAWGILSGYGWFLIIIALLALVAIYIMRESLELNKLPMQYAFGLLIGGILGNLIDRLAYGHVVDFLDFHFPISIPYIMPTGRYPTFNLADSGIVIGTIIYVFLTFLIQVRSQIK